MVSPRGGVSTLGLLWAHEHSPDHGYAALRPRHDSKDEAGYHFALVPTCLARALLAWKLGSEHGFTLNTENSNKLLRRPALYADSKNGNPKYAYFVV